MEKGPITGSHTSTATGSAGNEHEAGKPQEQADKDDSCRCKETAAMKPRELLRLMIGDLAFWKKANKG